MSGSVDWTAIRRRLAAGEAELARVLEVEGEQLDLLLRERARRLAAPERASALRTNAVKALVARCGPERYALPLARLAGVLPFAQCSPVAGSPPAMIGVFNGRGAIWAAFDLRSLLAADAPTEITGGRAVLLRHAHRRVALRVDEADDLCNFVGGERAMVSGDAQAASKQIIAEVASDGLTLLDVDALWPHPSIGETR